MKFKCTYLSLQQKKHLYEKFIVDRFAYDCGVHKINTKPENRIKNKQI